MTQLAGAIVVFSGVYLLAHGSPGEMRDLLGLAVILAGGVGCVVGIRKTHFS